MCWANSRAAILFYSNIYNTIWKGQWLTLAKNPVFSFRVPCWTKVLLHAPVQLFCTALTKTITIWTIWSSTTECCLSYYKRGSPKWFSRVTASVSSLAVFRQMEQHVGAAAEDCYLLQALFITKSWKQNKTWSNCVTNVCDLLFISGKPGQVIRSMTLTVAFLKLSWLAG